MPLDPVALLSSESARTDIPVFDHARSLVQSDGAQIGVEGFTYSSYAWQPVMTGKIDFLELFAGSARLSQVAAMNGLRVGQPIDLRTGLDMLTSDGRKRTMEIIEKQKPKVIFMAPHCAPWSQMTNIHDRIARDQRRQKFLPMLEFCCRIAIFQIEHGGHFIIENPASSALWYTRCFQRLLSQRGVIYGTLDMCSFGTKDPNGFYYNKPTSLLRNFDAEVMAPVFKRSGNKLGGAQHQHQPLEGSAPGYGSCSKLIRCLLPLGSHHGLFHAQTTVVVDLLDGLDIPSLKSLQLFLMENTDREFVHFSESDSVIAKDFYVRRSLPKGHEYNPWSESLHIAHDVSHMRQIFAPTLAFEHAPVLRGTFEPLKVRYRQTAGVLFLWRKKDTTKLYIQSHPFDDLSKLVESNWSCILFWNSDGRVPSKPVTTPVTPDTAGAPPAPPPGLDPDDDWSGHAWRHSR